MPASPDAGRASIGRRVARMTIRLAAMAVTVSAIMYVTIALGWSRWADNLPYLAYPLGLLGLFVGLGLAIGYLVATWHGREIRAYLMMWGTFGGGLGLAILLAMGIY